MKERFEQIAEKINQLPKDDAILRLIDFLESEIDFRLAAIRAALKWCGKCRKSKPRSEFYPRKTGGVRSVCKKCNRY
jgi:DNA-binding transcriptional MerR regulator